MTIRSAVLLSITASIAAGQLRPFLAVDGAPGNIERLEQDGEGFLWAAGTEGLFRFDGVRFHRLTAADGLPSEKIHDLAAHPDGSLWIATNAGLYRHHHGRVERRYKHGCSAVAVSASGRVLIAEVADFYRRLFVGDGINFQPIPDAEPVNGRLTMDGEAALYGCKGGLCEVDLSAAPPAFRRPIPLTRDDATTALRDASGNLWINYTGKAAVRWSATGAVQELPFDVAGGHYFLDRDTDGRVWIPSTNRLAIWRGGAFETTEPKHGLPARIRAMKITRDGTLWLGTETRGLYRWASRGWNWETWTEAQGLDEVWSVLPRSRTDVLAGGNGLLKLSPDRERWLRVPGTESLRFLTHLLPRPDGRILAGLYWGWMALLSAGGQVLFRPQERYISGMRLVQFPDGEVWMGNYPVMRAIPTGGRYEFRPLHVPGVGGMIASQDMELDARGRPWVCHNAGLSIRLSADEWKTVTTKDGLLQNWCRAIAVRGENEGWYGYNQEPAFSRIVLKDGGVEITHFRGAAFGNGITRFLQVDRRGWLWRGSADGVYVSDGKDVSPDGWVHLSMADGLPVAYLNQQGFEHEPDGSVWLMAGSTISHLRPPDDLFTRRLRPAPLIGGVQWGATRYAHVRMAPAELPSRPGTLRVELGSLFFEGRGSIRLRHRLLPDPEWRQTGFEAEYQVAPPGRYRLEVSARAGRGEWQPPAVYEFHVAPPFWQSVWTTAPAGCVVISAVWFVARRRTERVAFRRDKSAFLQARQRGQTTQRLSHHLRRMLEMHGDGGLLPDLSPWRRSALGQDPRERVGETLAGRYLLEELIGEGGFAAIYRAAELETGHSCAVKILKLEEAEREWILRRFEQEVSALRRLRHPGIVAYHDVGETAEGLPFLVMDHVPGVTLRAALEDGGFSIGRVARLTRQLAQAIASAHAGGVLHRDLKPENLMLVNGGQDDERLVVIDFSIALVKRVGGTMVGQSRAAGSLPYMAPEQLTGFSSPATDVYAFALVVFEMLTGRQALAQDWNGADLGGQVEALLRGLRTEVPAEAARYLAPALAFDPLARPAEIAVFGERLADLLESS